MRVEYLQHQHHKSLGLSDNCKVAVGPRVGQNKNTEKYNTRPAKNASSSGSVNFKGLGNVGKFASNILKKKGAAKGGDWVDRLVLSGKFNKFTKFAGSHSQIFGALVTMGLIGIVKPMLVLSMPGAEIEDKEQTAAKGFISALIGTLLTTVVCVPLKGGVDKSFKYLDPKSSLVQKMAKNPRYKDFYETLWKDGIEIILAPVKAAATIAIMPSIKKILFGKKEEVRKQQKLKREYQNILPNGLSLNGGDKASAVFGKFVRGQVK